MSIGDALAEGRRQAGLTVTQVSQRTCIRETIIRSIERGDFSGCGGDFYARGHIRSIASAVGLNPEPLIDQYDATMGAPRAISAADVFQPVTPVKLKERRRPNWTAAMAVALVVLVGAFFGYHHFHHTTPTTPASQDSKIHQTGADSNGSKPKPSASGSPAALHTGPKHLHITLTATRDCWVQLSSASSGATIFAGTVYAGTSMNWNERHAVRMTLGNPAGVKVLANGRSQVPAGTVSMITLNLHPSSS